MAHLFVRYVSGGGTSWGELAGPAPLSAQDTVEVRPLEQNPKSLRELIPLSSAGWDCGQALRIAATQLLSPVTADSRLVCQGLNYQSHAAEAQHAQRRSNLIFAKASSSLTGPFGDIQRPGEVQLLDYEVEFGLVLRESLGAGDRVAEADVGGVVAGIVLCNDVSARD